MKMKKLTVAFATVVTAATLLSGCGALGQSSSDSTGGSETVAEENWSFPAINRLTDGTTEDVTYEPIAAGEVTKEWNLCVLFPHMKDTVWVAENYGTLSEAQRDGVKYNLFEAGGYPNIDKQISQFQDCINGGYDAIAVAAVNSTALCPQIEAAIAKGIPVVDMVNGVTCDAVEGNELFSHAATSYKAVSELAAQWLVENAGADGAQAGVYPGPEGASWSDDVLDGWNQVTKGTNVTTVDVRRGDYGVEIQQGFIQDSITANPDINWIYGLSAAVQGGLNVLRQSNPNGIQILAGNPDPVVYQAVVDGTVAASAADFHVIQGRMAIDQAVRMLEGKQLEFRSVGPKPSIFTKDTVEDFDYGAQFAPDGFEPTYTWAP